MFHQLSAHRRAVSLALLGGLLAGALTAGPASAATISAADCASAAGEVSVEAVAISAGRTIVLQATPPDGTYQGISAVHVFCQDPNTLLSLGDISQAEVKITINPTDPGLTQSMFTIDGAGVATPGNPVVIGPFDGTSQFTVTGASNLLAPGVTAAKVGLDIEVVTQAWNKSLFDVTIGTVLNPNAGGDVLARTPELDSLVLLGSGAMGLLGYASLRRRARGSRKD